MTRPLPGARTDLSGEGELYRGCIEGRFNSELEAEFVRARLRDTQTLIRVACVFSVLISAARDIEQLILVHMDDLLLASFAFILASSLILTAVSFSTWFEKVYLPVAHVLVPARNVVVAAYIGHAAAQGQLEMLMLLPVLLLGPMFLMGFRFRAAVLCAAPTAIVFVLSAVYFHLPLATAARAHAFVLLNLIAGLLGARYIDRWSRTSFIEGRLIADLAQRDPLTGTRNRRVFDEYLIKLWQQATKDKRGIAILLIDVDHFKPYNDRYGHQAGDGALRGIAQSLQSFMIRPLDVLTRYGGEEFAAILYDVDSKIAQEMGERMRRAVAALAIEHRGSKTAEMVTISVGIASLEPTAGRDPRGGLLDEADHTLLTTGVFPNITVSAALGLDTHTVATATPASRYAR
jgi:diguanylate cyclase (GGDEF)-like protein